MEQRVRKYDQGVYPPTLSREGMIFMARWGLCYFVNLWVEWNNCVFKRLDRDCC